MYTSATHDNTDTAPAARYLFHATFQGGNQRASQDRGYDYSGCGGRSGGDLGARWKCESNTCARIMRAYNGFENTSPSRMSASSLLDGNMTKVSRDECDD